MNIPDNSGQIIYLNGTSSSGKTTLAEALLDQLEDPFLHFSINVFDQLPSRKQIHRGVIPDIARLELGFTKCVEALVASGNNVIVDDVIAPPQDLESGHEEYALRLLRERVTILNPYDVLFVKVYCPLCELERREAARGDRTIGLARNQFNVVHRHAKYDVDIDTSTESPADSATRILRELASHREFSAFREMSRTL